MYLRLCMFFFFLFRNGPGEGIREIVWRPSHILINSHWSITMISIYFGPENKKNCRGWI